MSRTAVSMLAVWAAAIGSVGALAYALNRPLTPVAGIPDVPAPAVDNASEQAPALPTNVTEIAPSVIVHRATPAHVRHAVSAPQFRELSEMRCGAWQDLMQGAADQQVRRCE